MIQATVAVYPLQQTGYDAVHRAIDALRLADVNVNVQAMHSVIAGESKAVFPAVQNAYEAAAALGPTVMTVTVSNACPVTSETAA